MALSRNDGSYSQPRSVEEIVHQAQDFEFMPNRSLRNWLRSAQMLLTEAAICEQDGDIQKAYLYMYRHAELVLGKLPQHPDYNNPNYKADLAQARKTIQKNLPKLEAWKPRIKQDHERFVIAVEQRNARRKLIQDQGLHEERQRITEQGDRQSRIGSEDGAFDDLSQRTLSVIENRELAVDLAQREIRRRDATRRPTRRAGISPDTVAARRRGVVSALPDRTRLDERPTHERDELTESIREAGRHLRHPSQHQVQRNIVPENNAAATSYQYPLVPGKEGTIDWSRASQPQSRHDSSITPPSLPSRDVLPHRSTREHHAPPIPPKARDTASASPQPARPSKTISHEASSSKYTFQSSSFTEAGAPLRTVMLPPELRSTFLNLAHSNTLRNLETCGILCGTLVSNALFINHLVIPDQKSTSDTCDTTEEGDNELFDFCDSIDLLVCGWIHTHPSQTCFLSSRDLHTSSGYQVMLPEAIAIVCAPRHNPDWGIFRLTDPPGLSHVLKCDQRGLFHPHSETNLYTDALRPGHVVEGPGLKFDVVDLRKG